MAPTAGLVADLYDRCVAKAARRKTGRRSTSTGAEAEDKLKELLAGADPVVDSSLDRLSISEEHYFAAVHQEGSRLPTAISSSAEV